MLSSPVGKSLRNEFRPVVYAQAFRFTSPLNQLVEFSYDTFAWETRINRDSELLLC
jgi:hypothetical protein